MESVTKDVALLVLGIIAGLLPWILDKLGIEMPRPVYLGLLYLCVGLIWWALVSLNWLDKIRFLEGRATSLSNTILACLGVAALLIVTWFAGHNSLSTETAQDVEKVPTRLRLQFRAENTIPSATQQPNIWRWYAMRTTFQVFDLTGQSLEKSAWSVFVVFEKPITYKQVTVAAIGSTLPVYEVNDSSQRSAIVFIKGEVTNTLVEIEVR